MTRSPLSPDLASILAEITRSADPGGPDLPGGTGAADPLLDKSLLARHYSPAVLASPTARAKWVDPDLIPIPQT